MKFIVCSRTTDDSPTDGRFPIEMEISQSIESLEGAEYWLDEVRSEHPELLDMRLYRQGRTFELGIKSTD